MPDMDVAANVAEAEIKSATHAKNFPRWARACPKSFDKLKMSIAQAAVLLHRQPLTPAERTQLSLIIGHVAATCWAAGRESVREAGLDTDGLDGK
jgi:hypothetical protein